SLLLKVWGPQTTQRMQYKENAVLNSVPRITPCGRASLEENTSPFGSVRIPPVGGTDRSRDYKGAVAGVLTPVPDRAFLCRCPGWRTRHWPSWGRTYRRAPGVRARRR